MRGILQLISVEHKYPWVDIHVLWISVFMYPCFYGYPFGYRWISMDIHALICYGFSIQGALTSGQHKMSSKRAIGL